MDWNFLGEISNNVEIPIVQPYNRLILNKETLYDCYIKIENTYVEFIDGYALSYSELFSSTVDNRTETDTYQNLPVIVDLTDIMKQLYMNVQNMKESLMVILDLFILGRLHHRNTTPISSITIKKHIIFPVLYLLNVLGSKYHIDALITYTLADIYNKIFERPFGGYSKEDRMNIRFYMTILFNFESTNTEIIYRFLRQNSSHSRLVDLLGVIRDYLSVQYYEDISDILKRLMIANNDQYIILETNISIPFVGKYGIIDRRQPTLKSSTSFTSDDIPLILFNTHNYQLPQMNTNRIITPQMIQDRLPLDINRYLYITLEGALTAILYPIVKNYFENINDNSQESLFYVYFINNVTLVEKCNVYKIQLKLSRDSLIISFSSLTQIEMFEFDPNSSNTIENQLKTHILSIASSEGEILVSINIIEFNDIYHEIVSQINDVLGLPPPPSPKSVNIINYNITPSNDVQTKKDKNSETFISPRLKNIKTLKSPSESKHVTTKSLCSPRPTISGTIVNMKRDNLKNSPTKTKHYPASPRNNN